MTDLLEAPVPDEYAPPQDIPAEQSVLGSWLLSKRAIDDCEHLVRPTDFYRPAHETIAEAILALHLTGEPADTITVADWLSERKALARVGGQAYLHQLVQGVPTSANADHYAEIVAEHAMMRRVGDVGTRIVTDVRERLAGPGDILAKARADLDDVAESVTRTEPSVAQDVYAAIEALESDPGIPTPWADLTAALGGWGRGRVYYIGARPAKGKSLVGMCAAIDAARRGHHALIASMEMSRTEIYQRMLCNVGSVEGTRMMRRTLTQDDYRRLSTAAAHIAGLPLTVVDDSAQRVVDIRSACRTASRRQSLGLVVIDYLQLMTSGQRVESRQVEVAGFSRGLKLLARELDVPVIVLAQLNRGPEARHDRRPTMGDLRESGSQEQDGDAVILLHRDPDGDQPDVLELLVDKHRHGPGNLVVKTRWEGQYSRISDLEWSPSGQVSA